MKKPLILRMRIHSVFENEAGFSEYARTQRLGASPFFKAAGGYPTSQTKSSMIFAGVNPKLKCHPNAQSRNVTFLLAQDTEFATALFCLQRVLAEVEAAPGIRRYRSTFLLRPGGRARGRRLKQLRLDYLSLLLFLFLIDRVLQRTLLIFNRDLSGVPLPHFHLCLTQGVGGALGFDLIDDVVIGEGQVF